ncbi:probable phosphatidylinositol/ phosphatidylcholine transfer protein [Coccomyxa sp. Obi]|nr:probable phosphatidylinositol/ phosphatidylcholine transfer protein [Coccomyxa sp. Obi]
MISEDSIETIETISKALRDLTSEDKALAAFCSANTIKRYVVARNGNIDATISMLRNTLEWRRQCRPEAITWQDVEKAGQYGRIEVAAERDRSGRPIIFYQLKRPMTACSLEEQTNFLIYNLETACKMADDAGVSQVIVAADLANFSEGLTQLANFIHLAQNHYPERLAFAVLSRPPTLFWLAWSAAQAFLDEKTRAKISLVYTDKELQDVLLPLIQPAHLYENLGGNKKDDFDLHKHRQRMQLMDLERQREAGFFQHTSGGRSTVEVQ